MSWYHIVLIVIAAYYLIAFLAAWLDPLLERKRGQEITKSMLIEVIEARYKKGFGRAYVQKAFAKTSGILNSRTLTFSGDFGYKDAQVKIWSLYHEMAHIKLNHFWKAWLLGPFYPLFVRRFENQANLWAHREYSKWEKRVEGR